MKNSKKFTEDNIELVYFLIRKYYPSFITDEDIIQCGMVGLCDAVNKYDETKSKFSNYATNRILGEIKNELSRRAKYSVETSLEQLLEGNKDVWE